MVIIASIFVYSNVLLLLGKQPPDLSRLEITEQSALEFAYACRAKMEEAVRWLLRVSTERDWFAFTTTVAGLWLLAYVASFSDLLTLLYLGIVMGMTVPVVYIKYEDKIKRCVEWVKVKSRKMSDMVNERIIKKVKKKINNVKEKEKKEE
ncbi:Reticulon domain-containing protein [Cephalotus follicularis]|uniref:Reticulon-like protein n=1 Tax=Cephalotus follicularis TaxID=3775 RepID=A0A1Q3D829_CEPFO|nr:Reticulon domain-containing protein [Cephalotus follicularis]